MGILARGTDGSLGRNHLRSRHHSITLSTYIFDNDLGGRRFLEALGKAGQRGVAVRVLIDDAGARYSWPSIVPALRRAGLRVARFLPTFSPRRLMVMNLRNHNKILVVDGRTGFTGGMNIRHGHLLRENPRRPVQDIHFRLRGPVVAQLQEVFANNWHFTTGEPLRGKLWFPALESEGTVFARGISDGPDEDLDKLKLTILGALTCARTSIQIVTPYFLPDTALISALNLAAMRGVKVDILLPERGNQPLVQWATTALLWRLLERGCRIWLTAPPFDHSKAVVVDEQWVLFGSANWDPRSLRLNFEFNVECYSPVLAETLARWAGRKRQAAAPLTLEQVDSRSWPIRLRDGLARLFSPYL